MTTKEIKTWIANLINAHKWQIAKECPGLTVEKVWHHYMDNSDDIYVNIADAFSACGYEIE